MQLLSDFYSVSDLHYAKASLTCAVRFNAAHNIFKGHFPGQPIVPGVCSLHIVRALLEAGLSQKIYLAESPLIKFLQLLRPASTPIVTISWKLLDNDGWLATAVFINDGEAAFKLSGVYRSVAVAH